MFFAEVQYNDTVLKWQFTVHVPPVLPHIRVHGSKKLAIE